MTIKAKILTLAILTVLVSAFGLTTINIIKINELSRDNINSTRERLTEIKKAELKQYTDLAYTAIQDLVQQPEKKAGV